MTQKKWDQHIKDICTPCLLLYYSQQTRHATNLEVHRWMTGWGRGGSILFWHTVVYYSDIKKKKKGMNSWYLHQTEDPDTNWCKPDMETKSSCFPSYVGLKIITYYLNLEVIIRGRTGVGWIKGNKMQQGMLSSTVGQD